MAPKEIFIFVLFVVLSRLAEGQPGDATKHGYGNALAKFMQTWVVSGPSTAAVANHGTAVTPTSDIAAGTLLPVSQPSVPAAMLKTVADLKKRNQEMKVARQRLRARIEKMPPARVKDSQGRFGLGVLAGLIASVGLATSFGVAAARRYVGTGQFDTESRPDSEIRLVPPHAGLISAVGLRGGDVRMAAASDPPQHKPTPPNEVVIDVEAQQVMDTIVQDELSQLSALTPEEQEARLPVLLTRMEKRAASEQGGYQFGDVSKAVVQTVRGEVKRQVDSDWTTDDISLLLKVALFLGAGAAAPVAGLAAMPAAVLLATYGTVLKAELGVRAVQEVGVRLAENVSDAVAGGVREYTGKDEYRFGDLTEETVHRITGNDEYKFGDVTRGAVKKVIGKDNYEFGDITKSAVKKVTGRDKYEFGDITKSLFRKLRGEEEKK